MSLSDRAPRVSIGIPVRNGARFLPAAVDALLSQTFEDFELIFCDNASRDQTPQICRDYESRDPRVRYHRNPRDLGPAENYSRCFRLARGEYFKWAAHDDVVLPTYLEKCVAVMDSDPCIVNCHTRTRIIDESGQVQGDYDFWARTDAPHASTRFGRLINVSHRRHVGYEIFGLMRREVMLAIPEQGAYAHADRVFLVRLCLRGRFHEVPEPLFLARRHATQSMAYHDRRDLRAWLARYLGAGPLPPPEWWDPSAASRIMFPDWNLLRLYSLSVREAPLSAVERARCRLHLARWVARYWPKLARDVIFAGERSLTRWRHNGGIAPAAAPAAASAQLGAAGQPPAAHARARENACVTTDHDDEDHSAALDHPT